MRFGARKLALFLVTLSACQGSCGQRTADPLRFVSKDAEAVLEIRDLGAVARSRAELARGLSGAVSPEQLANLEKELELSLGFSPTSEKGLEEAGLPKAGKVAVEIASGGSTALWIVPVKDTARFEKTLDRLARARANVDGATKVRVGDREATALLSSFGPDKVEVAVYAFEPGLALIGAGPGGKDLLARALARKPEDGTIADNPEYAALTTALGSSFELRLIAPRAAASASGTLSTLGRLGAGRLVNALKTLPTVEGVKSAGWVLEMEPRGLKVRGRVRLAETSLADMTATFTPPRASPPGVGAIVTEDAVIAVVASGDPKSAIARYAPAGSAVRNRLDSIVAKVKQDLGTNLEEELVPLLSGHGALTMGVGSLAGRDMHAILENPPSALWTLIAVGATDPAMIAQFETKMDSALSARGLEAKTRTLGDQVVHIIAKTDAAAENALVVESVTAGGARVFSNDAKMTEVAVRRAKDNARDPLDGKGGVAVELRLGQLVKALRTLDLGALPVITRAIASKAMQAIGLLDRIDIKLIPATDGLDMEAKVLLAPEAGAVK